MAKKRSLVRIFTRQVKSGEELEPSQFKVKTKYKPTPYQDSPIDELKRYMGEEEAVVKEKPKDTPVVHVKKMPSKKVDSIDHEKIKRIAKKLSMLKKMDLENRKKQAQKEGLKDWGSTPLDGSQDSNLNANVQKSKQQVVEPIKKNSQENALKKTIIPKAIEKPQQQSVESLEEVSSGVKKKSKFSLKGLFSNSKKPKEISPDELKKKKKVLDSEEISDIPNLPEDV